MTDNTFREGDELMHKTNNIKMIYIGTDTTGNALCEWTDRNGHPQRASFALTALQKYEKPVVGVIQTRRT